MNRQSSGGRARWLLLVILAVIGVVALVLNTPLVSVRHIEIEGANVFRVRAYRNAARTIGELAESVADLVARGEDLSKLPGIGKDLAGKIAEIVETGCASG